jgi:hypothetical protein
VKIVGATSTQRGKQRGFEGGLLVVHEQKYVGLWFWSITASADGQGSFPDFKDYMFTQLPS